MIPSCSHLPLTGHWLGSHLQALYSIFLAENFLIIPRDVTTKVAHATITEFQLHLQLQLNSLWRGLPLGKLESRIAQNFFLIFGIVFLEAIYHTFAHVVLCIEHISI